MSNNERYLAIEHPTTRAVVDFLSVASTGGFVVIIDRRPDGGVAIKVRQSAGDTSSYFHDTEFAIDPYSSGEDFEVEDEDEDEEAALPVLATPCGLMRDRKGVIYGTLYRLSVPVVLGTFENVRYVLVSEVDDAWGPETRMFPATSAGRIRGVVFDLPGTLPGRGHTSNASIAAMGWVVGPFEPTDTTEDDDSDEETLDSDDYVLVEVMPRSLRQSHTEAGNPGVFPHNGAVRVLLRRDEADTVLTADPEWTTLVRDARRADLARVPIRDGVYLATV